MTTSDVSFVDRNTRNHNSNKKTHRYVDERLKRREKLTFNAKRNDRHYDEDDSEET